MAPSWHPEGQWLREDQKVPRRAAPDSTPPQVLHTPAMLHSHNPSHTSCPFLGRQLSQNSLQGRMKKGGECRKKAWEDRAAGEGLSVLGSDTCKDTTGRPREPSRISPDEVGNFSVPLPYSHCPPSACACDTGPGLLRGRAPHQCSRFRGLSSWRWGPELPARTLRRFEAVGARPHPPAGQPLPSSCPRAGRPSEATSKDLGFYPAARRTEARAGSRTLEPSGSGVSENLVSAGLPAVGAEGRVLRAPRSGRVGSAAGPIPARRSGGRGREGGVRGRAGRGRGAASRRRRGWRRLLSVRLKPAAAPARDAPLGDPARPFTLGLPPAGGRDFQRYPSPSRG